MRDETDLQAAMDTHGDMVYRLALCRLGNRADAEDIYQDVFIRYFRDATRFRDEGHRKAWLIRTTLNRCRDLRRSAWFRHIAPLEDAAGQAVPTQEDYADLWQTVAALPADLGTVVCLHYAEGYTTDEIAALLGCRPATVRTRLHRARKKLRLDLEGYHHAAHGRAEQIK